MNILFWIICFPIHILRHNLLFLYLLYNLIATWHLSLTFGLHSFLNEWNIYVLDIYTHQFFHLWQLPLLYALKFFFHPNTTYFQKKPFALYQHMRKWYFILKSITLNNEAALMNRRIWKWGHTLKSHVNLNMQLNSEFVSVAQHGQKSSKKLQTIRVF